MTLNIRWFFIEPEKIAFLGPSTGPIPMIRMREKRTLFFEKQKKEELDSSSFFSCVVAQAGSAPATPAFSGQCSTN